MTSRNQREGHYDGYFRKHYRSRVHRLGQRDDSYIAFLHPEPDLPSSWSEDGSAGIRDFLQSALAIGELGTINRFRFLVTQ